MSKKFFSEIYKLPANCLAGSLMTSGGADRDRTDDIQLAKLALSQLSYSPDKTGGPR